MISGLVFWDGLGLKFSYMFIGAAIGLCIGYFVAGLMIAYKNEGARLIKKIRNLNPLRGRDINEVIDAVGGYTSKQAVTITDRDNEQGAYYNFVEGAYEVQLLVGADDIIIGVTKEVHHGKDIKASYSG